MSTDTPGFFYTCVGTKNLAKTQEALTITQLRKHVAFYINTNPEVRNF
jgi:hypothetical protein